MGSSSKDTVLEKFLVGFEGSALPGELASLLEHGLAGVAIYPRNFANVEGLRALTSEIRRAAGRPVLIGIDQEGGTRFSLPPPFTQSPSPAELGRLNDPGIVETVARAMARELRAAGVNLDFAPMLDLHVNPESPVTKIRSFGADPQEVARLGAAFIHGLSGGGVLGCAKHFPGHGDTQVDPHEDLPVFGGTMERLNTVELVPFAAAVTASVATVMTAHILLPKIDPNQPASLSRKILTEILRKQLGFRGVILVDDIGMGAIAKRYGPGEAAVRAIQAGADVVMLCHEWSAVRPAIEAAQRALERGAFDRVEWQESHERIERARAQSEATAEPQPPLDVIGCAEHSALSDKIRARLTSSRG